MSIWIDIKSIPHREQRYDTLGDWYDSLRMTEGGRRCLNIRLSDSLPDDDAFLVALHELIEVWICRKRGITQDQVDAWDMQFEKDRAEGKHGPEDEPGEHPGAPYRMEHKFAMVIEELLCAELGIKWDDHEAALNAAWESREGE